MICKWCIYEERCSLRELAPDLTGCDGHSKIKPEVEAELLKNFTPGVNDSEHIRTRTYTKLEDLKVGDRVVACLTTGTRIPRYLEDTPMTVVGFTKAGNVKCDLGDGGKLFNIYPAKLLKLDD